MTLTPADVAERLEIEFAGRTRTLIASELSVLGLDEAVLDADQAELVLAAGFATLLQLLGERDLDGRALWTLAGEPLAG